MSALPARKPGRPRKTQKRPRRSPGTGSISQSKSGRVYALDVADAAGHRAPYEAHGLDVDQRYADAERWLAERAQARARAAGTLPETVGQWLERWLYQTYRAAPATTIANYRARLKHAAPIADLLVNQLTPEAVSGVTDAMLDAGLSIRYARQVRQVLKSAFQPLVPRLLAENPVGAYRRPLRLPRRRPNVWDEPQAVAFLAHARRSRWGPLWTLALTYGLRHGELRALKWADLNDRSGALYLGRNLRPGRRESDRKNHSEDTLKLARPVVDELIALRGTPHSSPIWMFSARGGLPLGKSTLDDAFVALQVTANAAIIADALARGLSHDDAARLRLPPLTIHGLRHTAATTMLRRGVPIAKVSQLLGHHSPGFTFALYGWAVPTDDDRVDEAITGLLAEAVSAEFPSPLQQRCSDEPDGPPGQRDT